ncbi:MAG TPA: ABC transporter substrate-binding protein [Actinocrinis sp.]|jgi:peptide/nickel transport system substrate-binding protein
MTTRTSSRRINALAAALISILMLLASAAFGPLPASAATQSPPSQSGSTLRVAMDGSGVDTLNPFLAYYNASFDIFGAIYPTLTVIEPNGQPGPYLAKSWTLSPDHLTWTFAIRSGLKWSDGTPLTSADIAWTFNLIMTNPTAGTANGTLVANFAKVTAPNATTLVITTKAPEANLLYISTPVYSIPIVPKHIWASHVANLANYKNTSYPIVGYGPWVLTNYVDNQYAEFDANKDFVLGAPKYDHLIEIYYSNTDAAVAAVRSDQLDYINGLDPIQYKSAQSSKKVSTAQSEGNGWYAVELNPGAKTRSGKTIGTGNPALQDPTVRRAISLAIDKQTLVNKVLDGEGQPGAGYLPPAFSQWYWTPPAGEAQNYDPAQANKLLDQAGYTMGPNGVRINPKTGQPIDLRLGIHANDPSDGSIAPYLVSWLKAIGIQVTVQPMSMTALNSDLGKGDWDMLMDAWTGAPDPTYLLGIQTCSVLPMDDGTGGNTDSFFCNAQYDSLFSKQSTLFDTAQRAGVVDQMQQILYDADVDLVLYYYTVNIASSANVAGLDTGTRNAHGLYPAQNSFWSYLKAAPPNDPGSSSGEVGLWAGLAALVIIVGAGWFFLVRRRSGADDRE